jgi:imidazolonepropionase-like amidohydrolase
MNAFVRVCGNVFDGNSDALTGPAEILVEDNRIAEIERSVGRPSGARVIDLSERTERTVSPGFIDTHVHLTHCDCCQGRLLAGALAQSGAFYRYQSLRTD